MKKRLEEIEARVNRAHREICDLAANGGRERWRMSIPVRPDDSDMVLQAPLDDIAYILAYAASLGAEVKALREGMQQIRFDRGTNAGSTNAANYNAAAEALAKAGAIAFARGDSQVSTAQNLTKR